MPEQPTCFISYSHNDVDAPLDWILCLAGDLQANGVLVSLDCWDLRPGESIGHYSMDKIRECDWTLVVCTPRYQERSRSIMGGVGLESSQLTAWMLRDAGRAIPLVPILRGRDAQASIPDFLAGRMYVDMRTTAPYGPAFRHLVLGLFDEALVQRAPALDRPQDLRSGIRIPSMEGAGHREPDSDGNYRSPLTPPDEQAKLPPDEVDEHGELPKGTSRPVGIAHIHNWVTAKNPDLSKVQVRKITDDLFECIVDSLRANRAIRIPALGTFLPKKIPARRGGKLVKNPFTGEMVKQEPKPARTAVRFTPAKDITKP